MSSAEVAGTDIAYAVPLTAIAALGHWWLGSIHWELLASLLSFPARHHARFLGRPLRAGKVSTRAAGDDLDRRGSEANLLMTEQVTRTASRTSSQAAFQHPGFFRN